MSIISSFCHVSRSVAGRDPDGADTAKELTLTCAPGSSSCREGASLAG